MHVNAAAGVQQFIIVINTEAVINNASFRVRINVSRFENRDSLFKVCDAEKHKNQ